jgi:hypothetical protein
MKVYLYQAVYFYINLHRLNSCTCLVGQTSYPSELRNRVSGWERLFPRNDFSEKPGFFGIGNWITKLVDAVQLPITHYPLPVSFDVTSNLGYLEADVSSDGVCCCCACAAEEAIATTGNPGG